MNWDSYFAFIVAASALALVPGPTVTVIIANSLRFGPRAGLANVLGTQVGVAIWLVLAAIGLEAAIRVMGVWFDLLRYLGAAYLVWMGIKLFMSKGDLAVATAFHSAGWRCDVLHVGAGPHFCGGRSRW